MDNQTLVEKLRSEIGSGRVVTIAGTGVSVATCANALIDGEPVATWRGLLRHGIAYCQRIGAANAVVGQALAMQIDTGETDMLISAAQTISSRLINRSLGVFHGWLQSALGRLPVREPALIEALHAIPGILATLNYDDLIERVTGRRTLTWRDSERVQQALRGEANDAVLHFHGAVESPESVVLGLESYLEVRDHPLTRAVLELTTLDRTLLFVGCGDTLFDPNFSRLIEWGATALKEVVPRHFLLCREQELPALQQRLTKAPWLQLAAYGTQYAELEPFLRELLPKTPPALFPRASFTHPAIDLKAYKQAMRKRYGRLKIDELDATTHDMQPLSLTRHYVPQSAREWKVNTRASSVERLRSPAPGHDQGLETHSDDVLASERLFYNSSLQELPRLVTAIAADPRLDRLAILGDPGSGKSTLLQYLVLLWAEATMADDKLVLLIELREYARLRKLGEVSSFIGYLHAGAVVRWQFDEGQLVAWLRGNPSVVLFDGLDEVLDPALREEVSIAIHRFADDYPRARVLVSSRKVDFRYPVWQAEGFRVFVLQELDDAQIADFLGRWHQSTYEDELAARSHNALLITAMRQSTAIRRLAGNPLLLTMMAILSRTQELPRDRAELYEQCVRLLLHQWNAEIAVAQDSELARGSLDYQDKRSLLMRVARVMQAQERGLAGNLIDEETLERTLTEGLREFPGLRPGRAARALIEQLRGRNFMLSSAGPRFYAFVHRTFLEYFCALDIRDRFQNEQVLSLQELKTEVFGQWRDPSAHEVLCLLCGMIAPRFVAEILTWLIDQHDRSSRVLLAARCLNEVRKRHEIREADFLVRTALEQVLQDHLTEQDIAVVVSLATSVWRNAPDIVQWLVARMQPNQNPYVRAAALREWARGWPSDPQLFPTLVASAQCDPFPAVRATAIVELQQRRADGPTSFEIIKTCAESDKEPQVRCAAISALAGRWKDDPQMLPWLKGQLEVDESSSVRLIILRELSREWHSDPSVASILKARARSDISWLMRRAAIVELARGFRDEVETLGFLKECASTDNDSDVRWAVLDEVSRGWRDDPETLPWLQDRAVSDGSRSVRTIAMQLIARGWADDPQALRWLKVRGQLS